MGAVLADDTDTALSISESDQFLAQQFYPHGGAVRPGNFFRQQRRNPVAPDQISHRRAGSCSSKKFIVLFG